MRHEVGEQSFDPITWVRSTAEHSPHIAFWLPTISPRKRFFSLKTMSVCLYAIGGAKLAGSAVQRDEQAPHPNSFGQMEQLQILRF